MGLLADASKNGSSPVIPQDEGNSFGGFIGNLWGGLEGLVQGVGALAGAAVHDVAKLSTMPLDIPGIPGRSLGGGSQLLKVGQAALPDFVLPGPGTGSGAILGDLAERYGALNPFDDRPASEFFQQLYDKPVSFGLDALTVASAGAKVAGAVGATSLGGKAALEAATAAGAEPTGALATYAKVVNDLQDVGVSSRTAKAAGIRSALDDLAKTGDTGLAQTLKPLLPSPTYTRFGNTADSLKLSATTYNPLTRVVKGATVGKVMSEPLMQLGREIEERLAHVRELSKEDRNLLALKQGLFAKADDLGMTRIGTDKAAEFRNSQVGRTLTKVTNGDWIRERLRASEDERQLWVEAHNTAEDASEWNAAEAEIQGTNVLFTDSPVDPAIAKRIGDRLGDRVKSGRLNAEPAPALIDNYQRAEGAVADAIDIANEEPGAFVYHTTEAENLTNIGANGLQLGEDGTVSFTATPKDLTYAAPHGGRAPERSLIRIAEDAVGDAEFGEFPGEGYVQHTIAPDALEVLGSDGVWRPVVSGDRVKPGTLAPPVGPDGTAVITEKLTEISPTARVALEGGGRRATTYLSRVDAIIAKIQEFKQRLADNSEGINELNPDFDVAREVGAADRMIDHFARDAEQYLSHKGVKKGKIGQRLLDAEKMSKLWENYQYTPRQMIEESLRASRVLHGAEVIIGAGGVKGLLLRDAEAAAELLRAHVGDLEGARQALDDFIPQGGQFQTAKGLARAFHKVTTEKEFRELIAPAIKKGADREQLLDIMVHHQRQGGVLADVLGPGGLANREGLSVATMGELRDVLGDELVGKITDGVTSVSELRGRLNTLLSKPGKLVEGNGVTGPEWEVFDDAFRNMDELAPTYYPHINNIQHKTSDWFLPKRKVGAVSFAKDPHLNYNTEALFRNGNYITDPIEAYTRRAARGVRMEGTVRMINAYLETSGRAITGPEQLATGEVVMAPAAHFLRKQFSDKFDTVVSDLRLRGVDPAEAGVSAFYKTTREVQDEIVAKLASAGGIKMYAVPEVVAKHMNDAAKWAGIIPRGARLYVDGPMNVWRSLVLAGSPRWIVNNVIGNAIFSVMQGAPLTRAMHLLEQRFKRVLNEMNDGAGLMGHQFKTGFLDSVEADLKELGLRDDRDYLGQVTAGGYNKSEQMVYRTHVDSDTRAGKLINKTRDAPGRTLKRFQKIGEGVRNFNSEIEAAFRENSFITAAERAKGISRVKGVMGRFERSQKRFEEINVKGMTEAQAKAAVNEVNHFLGDFSNLGPLERHIVRRFVFPFWGFYKFQAKLMLTFPFEYPLRASVLNGLAQATQELTDQYGPMPSWLQAATPLSPPGAEVKFLTSSGPNPFSGLIANPLSQLSPLLKIPLEQFQGRDSFTGQRFSDANTYTPFGSDQSYDVNTGAARGAPRKGLLESVLGQVPQYEMLKELVAGGKTYDTSNIIQAIQGQLTDDDRALLKNDEGTARYPQTVQDVLARFLGFPTTSYNLEKYQASLEQGSTQALREGIRRAG